MHGKESVVARLFGFGRKRNPEADQEPPLEEEGFARVESEGEPEQSEEAGDPEVTIPEQVIRIRTRRNSKDEAVQAITDSFRELSGLLGSVTERLDRQDSRSANLADQLTELPEYLRTLPQIQREQNDVLKGIGEAGMEQAGAVRELSQRVADGTEAVAGALRRLPEIQEEQSRSLQSLYERVAEGNEAVHGVADALARIPEEYRQHAHLQEEAIRHVASAQRQTAKVIYAGHQKSLQLFQQATQKTLTSVHQRAQIQQEQMEDLLQASVSNMKRMFVLAAAFMGAALVAVVALMWLN